MKLSKVCLVVLLLVATGLAQIAFDDDLETKLPVMAVGQRQSGNTKAATLTETLHWLTVATGDESSDQDTHHEFDSKGCDVVITETRFNTEKGFWIKESFSLADIDPTAIKVVKGDVQVARMLRLPEDSSTVEFHTTNYDDKILHTSSKNSHRIYHHDYYFETNDEFAPRFAKALRHAVELCGGKPSVF